MGRSSKYTKGGILCSLLTLYDSGIPLTNDGLRTSGNANLLSAICRDKTRSKHLIFFDGLKDTRAQLAVYVSQELGDIVKANNILSLNDPPRRKKYNKLSIKNALLEHFDSGGSLAGDVISRTWMHNAIYYEVNGKKKTYGSLIDAREALASFLDKKGRHDDANKVGAYNLPPDRSMSEEEKELTRQELIKTLHRKIDDGENLGYRAQQSSDRSFVTACNDYFGSYANIFLKEGLNYQSFANRPLNKDPEEYFNLLLNLIESTGTFMRSKLEELDFNLMGRINKYEHGYYNFLNKARLYYVEKNNFDMVRSIDDFLESDERTQRDITTKENERKRKDAVDSIMFFEKNVLYDVSDLFPEETGELPGLEIMTKLDLSSYWLSSVPLSEKLFMERSNIKNLFHHYPERIVKIVLGNQQKYYFHTSIVDDETSQGKVFDRIVNQELNKSSRSVSERKYFRGIILPRLEGRLRNKALASPDEIRWWFYEFGGLRVVESHFYNNTRHLSKKELKSALPELNSLCIDLYRGVEENVYQRLQSLLNKI